MKKKSYSFPNYHMHKWRTDNIDAIMVDIREACRGKCDSAPENTIMGEFKWDLEEAAKFMGSQGTPFFIFWVFPYGTIFKSNRNIIVHTLLLKHLGLT